VPSTTTTKGKIELFVNTPFGDEEFTFELNNSLISCQRAYHSEVDSISCKMKVYDDCGNFEEEREL